jgi:hypothetical protein
VIVARGFAVGGIGSIVAGGLCRANYFIGAGGGSFSFDDRGRRFPTGTARQDERDLLEILPALIGALNASRTH